MIDPNRRWKKDRGEESKARPFDEDQLDTWPGDYSGSAVIEWRVCPMISYAALIQLLLQCRASHAALDNPRIEHERSAATRHNEMVQEHQTQRTFGGEVQLHISVLPYGPKWTVRRPCAGVGWRPKQLLHLCPRHTKLERAEHASFEPIPQGDGNHNAPPFTQIVVAAAVILCAVCAASTPAPAAPGASRHPLVPTEAAGGIGGACRTAAARQRCADGCCPADTSPCSERGARRRTPASGSHRTATRQHAPRLGRVPRTPGSFGSARTRAGPASFVQSSVRPRQSSLRSSASIPSPSSNSTGLLAKNCGTRYSRRLLKPSPLSTIATVAVPALTFRSAPPHPFVEILGQPYLPHTPATILR